MKLENFHYGPILSIDAVRVQRGFYTTTQLGLVGREILGNLSVPAATSAEQAYDSFFSDAPEAEVLEFILRQFKVAESFKDDVMNWINLSPLALDREGVLAGLISHLVEMEKRLLRPAKFFPKLRNVSFEIVERGELSDLSREFLWALDKAGYHMALDDVGSPEGVFYDGYQVERFLGRVPAIKLKIDASLVVNKTPDQVVADVTKFLDGVVERSHIYEITLEGVPVNPHATSLKPELFTTERARQLFASYDTNSIEWNWALKRMQRELECHVTVQLPPVSYEDLVLNTTDVHQF